MRVYPAVTMLIMAMPVAAACMQQACAVGGFGKGSCFNLYNSILDINCNNDSYIYISIRNMTFNGTGLPYPGL